MADSFAASLGGLQSAWARSRKASDRGEPSGQQGRAEKTSRLSGSPSGRRDLHLSHVSSLPGPSLGAGQAARASGAACLFASKGFTSVFRR